MTQFDVGKNQTRVSGLMDCVGANDENKEMITTRGQMDFAMLRSSNHDDFN